jgi:hypothetical protein
MKALRLTLIALAFIGCYVESSRLVYAADLSITTSEVKVGGVDTKLKTVQFGETVTKGMAVGQTGGKYYKTDADAAGKYTVEGIVLNDNSTNGYGQIVTSGPIVIGATAAPTVGLNYMLSDSNGGGLLCPDGDLDTGDYISSVGHCTAAGTIWVNIKNYGVAK